MPTQAAIVTPRPYVVGLTGGIGSGKSAAGGAFSELGAALVDADAIAHQLSAPGGSAIAAIVQAFGAQCLTASGGLDRDRMRALVFADDAARKRLEGILHPLIRVELEAQVRAATSAYVIAMIPLLIESANYRQRVDRVLVVDCDETQQIERVAQRSGLEAAQVRAIMARQVSRESRLAAADDILDNSGGLATMRLQAEALHRRYLAMAASQKLDERENCHLAANRSESSDY